MPASITAGKLALAGAGLVFLWSGLRGASVTGSLRDILTGKQPTGIKTTSILGGPGDSSAGGGSGGGGNGAVSNSAIAEKALSYVGAPYLWGGANAPHGADCSGLCNDIRGRDLGGSIPGSPSGKFSGHGPVTMQWLVWNGMYNVPKAQAEAGDFICWQSHMGVVVGPDSMVSAYDSARGTIRTTFAGGAPLGEIAVIRRFK